MKIRLLTMLGLLAAGAVIGAQPASAQYDGPWCAHMNAGWGFQEKRCDIVSYERCRAEIRATPGAWCTQNPYYRGPGYEPRRKAHRRYR